MLVGFMDGNTCPAEREIFIDFRAFSTAGLLFKISSLGSVASPSWDVNSLEAFSGGTELLGLAVASAVGSVGVGFAVGSGAG